MKKLYALLAVVAMVGAVNAQEWNISSADFNALGTISATQVVNGLTMYATDAATIVVDANGKDLDGVSYTHRMKMAGTGTWTDDNTPASRILSFAVTKKSTISIICMSSSSSAERKLSVTVGDKVTMLGEAVAPSSALAKTDISYTSDSPATIYIFSPSSGVNIYSINITEAGDGNRITLNESSSALSVEYFTLTGVASGSNYEALPAGVYIQKSTYVNGAVESVKISKSKK